MDDSRIITNSEIYEIKENARTAIKYIVEYATIAGISVAEGVCEAIFNVPGPIKYLVPIISGLSGKFTRTSKDPDWKKREGFPELEDIIEIGGRFVLSGVCELGGYGTTKGLMAAFS